VLRVAAIGGSSELTAAAIWGQQRFDEQGFGRSSDVGAAGI